MNLVFVNGLLHWLTLERDKFIFNGNTESYELFPIFPLVYGYDKDT